MAVKTGYDDVERGERGSSEEHLIVTQFKVSQEQQRLGTLGAAKETAQSEIVGLQNRKADAQKDADDVKARMMPKR